MSSVTSCVGGGLFICCPCLHVPYSTVILITWCGADAKMVWLTRIDYYLDNMHSTLSGRTDSSGQSFIPPYEQHLQQWPRFRYA
jgi:hypothetical protein